MFSHHSTLLDLEQSTFLAAEPSIDALFAIPEIAAVLPGLDGSTDIVGDLRAMFADDDRILELIEASIRLFHLRLMANATANHHLHLIAENN